MFRHRSIIPLLFAFPTMTNALFSNCEKDGDLKSRKKRKKLHVWNNDWDMMSESRFNRYNYDMMFQSSLNYTFE